jgi:hypothetical protein
MATLANSYPTLLDVAQRLDPGGQIDKIAELLSAINPVLDYLPMMEGNLPTGHKSTVRDYLPTAAFRKLYGVVSAGKSGTSQIIDSCGMIEQYAVIDKALADLAGNAGAFRLSEAKAYIEAMSQKAASSLFYANEALVPEGFTGLAPRYASTSANNSANLISGGGLNGQTDCTSIWLLGFSPDTLFGIYPKGSQAGLKRDDKGQMTLQNFNGGTGFMEAYVDHFRWDLGLVLRDWRYDAATGADLITLMVQAEEHVPSLSNANFVWCGNRNVMQYLRTQKIKKVAYNLTDETVGGKHVTMFDGIPFLRTDALVNTETSLN